MVSYETQKQLNTIFIETAIAYLGKGDWKHVLKLYSRTTNPFIKEFCLKGLHSKDKSMFRAIRRFLKEIE